jgi:hypothetical protein
MSDERKRHVAHAGAVLLTPIAVAERPLPPERQPAPLPTLTAVDFAKLRDAALPTSPAPADTRRAALKFRRERGGQVIVTGELSFPASDGSATFTPTVDGKRDRLAAVLAEARADFLATDPGVEAWRALRASLEGVQTAVDEAHAKVEALTGKFGDTAKTDSKNLLAAADKLTSARATLHGRRELADRLAADVARAETAAKAGLEETIKTARQRFTEACQAERKAIEERLLADSLNALAELYALHLLLSGDLAHAGPSAGYCRLD